MSLNEFDQSARFAGKADPNVVPLRLLQDSGLEEVRFHVWEDTRTLPLPGGQDRTADLVATVAHPTSVETPWLLVVEMQSQADLEKLEVTLEQVGNLRKRVRHGADGKGKYLVLAGLVYLVGHCPEEELNMTLPNGKGTAHRVLVWNVADDDARKMLEAVCEGRWSWGMLFWIVLMAGADDATVIERWKEVVLLRVEDREQRQNLVSIALVFAELAGRRPQWQQALEGFDMMRSEVVQEWIGIGRTEGELKASRRKLVELLRGRFPGEVPDDIVQFLQQQESMSLLDDWFRTAIGASTFAEFLAHLKQ